MEDLIHCGIWPASRESPCWRDLSLVSSFLPLSGAHAAVYPYSGEGVVSTHSALHKLRISDCSGCNLLPSHRYCKLLRSTTSQTRLGPLVPKAATACLRAKVERPDTHSRIHMVGRKWVRSSLPARLLTRASGAQGGYICKHKFMDHERNAGWDERRSPAPGGPIACRLNRNA